MRRREFVGAMAAGLLAGLPRSSTPARSHRPTVPRFIERWSWAMGQSVHLKLFAESDDAGYQAAAAALAELRRIEDRLSRFEDRSDLSELNRQAGRGPFRADADLLAVLAGADALRRRTGGALNVAVEPLMRAWGFHQPRQSPPSDAELAEARQAVGRAVVVIQGEWVTLPTAHTQLDLGGVGVGYGLDRMGAVLRREGIRSGFIDISGDCLALGAPPGEPGWLVEIADSERPGTTRGSIRLRDRALATSANTVSVVRYGDLIAGHVMDPGTGRPATRRRQATVVAASGLEADGLSTAALVTGESTEY